MMKKGERKFELDFDSGYEKIKAPGYIYMVQLLQCYDRLLTTGNVFLPNARVLKS